MDEETNVVEFSIKKTHLEIKVDDVLSTESDQFAFESPQLRENNELGISKVDSETYLSEIWDNLKPKNNTTERTWYFELIIKN